MHYLSVVLMSLLISLLAGCASIFNGIGPEPIQVQSTPPGAKCNVRTVDSETVIATIITPNIVMLKKKSGYFQPAHYRVLCSLEEKEPREALVDGRISGWYFGNIAIGGALGMLLVDPATGGMWTLSPETVLINFDDKSISTQKEVTPQAEDAAKVSVVSHPAN